MFDDEDLSSKLPLNKGITSRQQVNFSVTRHTYPKVHLQISCPAKLSISHLKADGHFIVFMQLLVETLSRMRTHLDIMRQCDAGQGDADTEARDELHVCEHRRTVKTD